MSEQNEAYESGKRFGEMAASALKQAIEKSLQAIDALSQRMRVVESTAVVLDSDNEQQKALPAPQQMIKP